MKKEFAMMKLEFSKNQKKQKSEINALIEDYKSCMEDLRKETHARNEAETLVKVLKETLEVKDDLKKHENNEGMEVDDSKENCETNRGEWEQQRKEKRKVKKRAFRSDSVNEIFTCSQCDKTFLIEGDLREHVKIHVQSKFQCEECEEIFGVETSLKNHALIHTRNKSNDCMECDEKFTLKSEIMEHIVSHSQKITVDYEHCGKKFMEECELVEHMKSHVHNTGNSALQCNICDKRYGEIRKLRRHDWRSHRGIDCTICNEKLLSREEIKGHRQTKHKMFRKIACKFFPDCLDGDECLFEHENLKSDGLDSSMCPNGLNCVDQSCVFSEQKHKRSNRELCRYQAKCNRSGCRFTHNVERTAFLGVSHPETRKM